MELDVLFLVYQALSLSQGTITDILEENVVQPLLVSTSAIKLAAETVRSIMKVDDIVSRYYILRHVLCIAHSSALFSGTQINAR